MPAAGLGGQVRRPGAVDAARHAARRDDRARRSRRTASRAIYVLGARGRGLRGGRQRAAQARHASSGSRAPDPVANAIAVRPLHATAASAGTSSTPATASCSPPPRGPLDAAAAAPLSASRHVRPAAAGHRGARRCPQALQDYLLDIQPGYDKDPVRGVYNHGWLMGDEAAISADVQSRIDALLEIQPVDTGGRLSPMAEAEQPERLRPSTASPSTTCASSWAPRRRTSRCSCATASRKLIARPAGGRPRAAARRAGDRAARAARLHGRDPRRAGFQDGQRPLRSLGADEPTPGAPRRPVAAARTRRPRDRRRAVPRGGAAGPPRRAAARAAGVRRPVVAGRGEQLREQDREHDAARRLRVRAAARLSAQGDQEQRADGRSARCTACQGARTAGPATRVRGDDARRDLPRLLALVLARGAGRARRAGRRARAWTPSGSPRPGGRTRSRCSGCWPARPSGSRSAAGLLQIPARPPTATAMAAATLDVLAAGASGSGSACPARRSPRAGTASRSRGRSRARASTSRSCAPRSRARPLRARGPRVPACRWTGAQAAEAARQARAGADPDLPRRGRPEGGRAGRRDRRRLAAVHARSRARRDAARAARPRARARGPHARGHRRRRVPRRWRVEPTTSTRRATRCAPGSRSTSARWARKREELLRRARRPRGPRRRGARVPGGVPRPATASAPPPRSRRADRRDGARHHAGGARRAAGRLRGASASTRCVAVPCGRRPAARSCGRWRRRRDERRCEPPRRAPPRPGASRGSALTGPFPVGALRGAAARAAARVHPRAGLRRGVRLQGRPREGVVRAARRRAARCRARCGARTGTRSACAELADGAQVVAAGGCDYYPGSRTSSPSFSFAVDRRAASPARATCWPSSSGCAARCDAEGLFEPQKRLPRPALPRTIGVVTGEGGKARDDVLAGLRRRGWAGRRRVGVRARCRTATPRPRSPARCRTSPPARRSR